MTATGSTKMPHDDGNARHGNIKGQHNNGRHDGGYWRHNGGDGQHDDE